MALNKIKLLKIALIAALAIIFLIVAAFFLREFIANYLVRLNLSDIEAPGAGSRLLVFAPHNDDEVLGAGELIKKTLKNGGQVKVVLVTNGDGFRDAIKVDYFKLNPQPQDFISFGYMRQQESIRALGSLGLKQDNIIFLGYPDGGVSYLWNANWDTDKSYTSRFTKTDRTPYMNSYSRGTEYAGGNVAADMSRIILDFKPTHIVYPHPNDRHPDHWSTNAFVKYTLAVTGYKPQHEWLYLVHRGDWPTPMKKNTKMFLVPPAKLLGTGTHWDILNMGNDEIKEKARAIHMYKSQFRPLVLLMSAFERKNELFGEYPDAKLIDGARADADVQPYDDNRIITDPVKDAISLEMNREADISGVYAEISKERNLHVFIESDTKIKKTQRYDLNLVFFEGKTVKRLNLIVMGSGAVSARGVSIQSITEIPGVRASTEGKLLRVVIPESVTSGFDHVFINANSSKGEHAIDRTAWRMADR